MSVLEEKNIVITGATGGIGIAVAVMLASEGAALALIGRNIPKLKSLIQQLAPGNHEIFPFDLSEVEAIESLSVRITDCYPKIHGFVHAAGTENTTPFAMTKPAFAEDLFRLNTLSGFELARNLIKKKYSDSEKGASLVFLASVMGTLGQPGKLAYCLSKGAIVAGVKAIALELAPRKIRVNSISPGLVDTAMSEQMHESLPADAWQSILKAHPLGIGKPSDVASLCLFLLSDASSWITGANINIDGGYSSQ